MKKTSRVFRSSVFFVGCLFFGMIFYGGTSGCGGTSTGSGGTGGSGGSGGSAGAATGNIVDETGSAITAVDTNDPVKLSLSGLTANTQYNISVTAPDGTTLSPSGGFIATADEEGNLPSSSIIRDLSTTPSNATLVLDEGLIVPRIKAQTGTYNIAVADPSGNSVFSGNFAVADRSKVFCADSTGTARASFLPTESVYARLEKGTGSLADGTYSCYVSSDLNAQYADGDTLVGTNVSVTVASGVGSANLGTYALGQYDVVCDLNGNGKYNKGTDLISRSPRFDPCFTIQNANTGSDIIGQVCSDKNGNYKDIFDPNATDSTIRDVWAWIAPQERSLVQHAIGVRKYVVAHKSSWTNGDTLTDVTGASGGAAFELDAVQGFCTNEAPWLVWPRQRLVAGCYDCIIDVNHNGVYDKGTDFIDNIDNSGDNTIGGMCISNTGCEAAITITAPTNNSTITQSTTTLSGSVTETFTNGKATITSGSSSNTVNVELASGAFSSTIPLFNGDNVITLQFTKSDGSICTKTIKVTADFSSSSNELLKVTATWDQDSDIDLHLVEPSGLYDNQGDSGTATDCNYSNCKTPGISWGALLDIDDCISGSCSNGRTENITISSITTAGDYKIYTDAFSDDASTGVNVTVTVFIRGAQVGRVTCSGQRYNTSTDTCFIGTVSWTGTGTTGNGTFTQSGTEASNF